MSRIEKKSFAGIVKKVIQKVSKTTNLHPSEIEQIISFQFKSVLSKTKVSKSIELSGLCYFLLSEKKLKKAISRAREILAAYEIEINDAAVITKAMVKRKKSCEQLIREYESRLERTCTRYVQ